MLRVSQCWLWSWDRTYSSFMSGFYFPCCHCITFLKIISCPSHVYRKSKGTQIIIIDIVATETFLALCAQNHYTLRCLLTAFSLFVWFHSGYRAAHFAYSFWNQLIYLNEQPHLLFFMIVGPLLLMELLNFEFCDTFSSKLWRWLPLPCE